MRDWCNQCNTSFCYHIQEEQHQEMLMRQQSGMLRRDIGFPVAPTAGMSDGEKKDKRLLLLRRSAS
jgi:hypothetical protein